MRRRGCRSGLAWEELDLDAATARSRRASVYIDGRGQQLGPPKDRWRPRTLAHDDCRQPPREAPRGPDRRACRRPRTADPHLRRRRDQPRLYHPERRVDAPPGNRQDRQQAAKTAGIKVDLSIQAGRRTVITNLYVDGNENLDVIAHFVGHAKSSTTAGHVRRLGRRPEAIARRAASVLDGQADGVTNVADDQSAESDAPGLDG